MVRSTLSEMIEKLANDNFIKINRSTIVNTMHIDVIKTDKIVIADRDFSISKMIKDELLTKLKL